MLKGGFLLIGGTAPKCQNHLILVLQWPQLVTPPFHRRPLLGEELKEGLSP